MKRIKLFENFNPDDLLMRINFQSESDRYHSPQLNTIDNSVNAEFITYLWSIADIKRIDALGGTESKSGFRRYTIAKQEIDYIEIKNGLKASEKIVKKRDFSDLVKIEDIIHMAPTGIAAGIKVTKYPLYKIMSYDQWENGYIEGFIRMDSDDPRFGEYFIWTYIKMDKLKDIIEKFGDKLELL